MNKKSLFLLVILIASTLLIAMPKPMMASTNKFYIYPTPQSGTVGRTVSVNVMIDSFTDLNAYQFALRWDKSVLKFKDITFVWLHTQGDTDYNYEVSLVGDELLASEWFLDPTAAVTGVDKVFVTITWDIIAGGECTLKFTEQTYWQPGSPPVEVTCTAVDGKFYTEEPFVDFKMTPLDARINENITLDGRLSKATEGCLADIGGYFISDYNLPDGWVDSTDLGILGRDWGYTPGSPADFGDGVHPPPSPDGWVDSTDLGILGAFWGGPYNYIVSYSWTVDGVPIGSSPVVNVTFGSYSKVPHNITLTATDSEGDSYTLLKKIKVDRDLAIFSIWPSMEDLMGSISFNIPVGKMVSIMYRSCNLGTITEYTNNAKGDFSNYADKRVFPATQEVTVGLNDADVGNIIIHDNRLAYNKTGEKYLYYWDADSSGNVTIGDIMIWNGSVVSPGDPNLGMVLNTTDPKLKYNDADSSGSWEYGEFVYWDDNLNGKVDGIMRAALYLIHEDGTEELLHKREGTQLRRYPYGLGPTPDDWTLKYDWASLVGVYYWAFWDTFGYEPENNLMLKVNITDPGGDTDLSNNVLLFGPFNLTEGYDHDIRIEGIWTYDEVSYYHAMPPYPGTTFKYFYGPYTPGTIANVTVGLTNIGKYNETNIEVYITIGSNSPDAPRLVDCVTGETSKFISLNVGDYDELTWAWNTTGYYGQYTLYAHIVPVAGETEKWNTWDNNVPGQDIPFFSAYDDWGIFSEFP